MSLFDDIERFDINEITSSQFWEGIISLLRMGGEVTALVTVFIVSIKGLALVSMVFPPAVSGYLFTPVYVGQLMKVIMKNYIQMPYDQRMKIARTCAVFNRLTDPSVLGHVTKIISGFQHSDVHKEIVSLVNNSTSLAAYSDFDYIHSTMRSGAELVSNLHKQTYNTPQLETLLKSFGSSISIYHQQIAGSQLTNSQIDKVVEKISKAVKTITMDKDSDPLAEFLVWGLHENAYRPESRGILAGFNDHILSVESRFETLHKADSDFANLCLNHLSSSDRTLLETQLHADKNYLINNKHYLIKMIEVKFNNTNAPIVKGK